ncbi:thymidylate synthase [Hydrogenophaga sp. H7]|uniref:thymidylate synthase n=1 Tax=Hydrogenophaga sp. H7 TaxID=1882399 RepID=UPI0009A2E435|nr:thymidylate synthase [Hydrogenophaga sp. H7]
MTHFIPDSSNHGEQGYLNMLHRILTDGKYRKPEGEEGRKELFAQPLRFDLSDNKLPLMTTKKTFFKSLAVEMLWFISGEQDVEPLKNGNVKIWDLWANEEGVVGPLYGFQWRHWRVDPEAAPFYGGKSEIDQLAECISSLRNRPEARSHMITAWRPDHLKLMSIKPCHILLQFYRHGSELSLMLTQRSCDAYLGVPFNIAQYSLLTHMVAHQLGCTAKEFIWVGGDVHIYENHFEQVSLQLKNPILPPPKIEFKRTPESIDDYRFEDFVLVGYESAGYVPGEVSAQGQPGKGVRLPQAWRTTGHSRPND